jgi:Rad3-related DNA helicase
MPEGWSWRPQQQALVSRIVNSPKKIIILQAEPGVGKTIMAKAAIEAIGQRAMVLVRTRQLERQYIHDFSDIVLMEGRRHSECLINGETADKGPCTVGWRCDKAGKRDEFGTWLVYPECPYYVKKLHAMQAPISVHNYAYWLHETMFVPRSGFRNAEVIICDEAHELVTLLMEMGSMGINYPHLLSEGLALPPESDDIEDVKLWASRSIPTVFAAVVELKHQLEGMGLKVSDSDQIEEDLTENDDPTNIDKIMQSSELETIMGRIRRLEGLNSTLVRISRITDISANYVMEREQGRLVLHDLYGRTAFDHLRSAARQKLVLMSAYLAPKLLMEALGITEDEAEIIEAEPAFDRSKSKIVYMPTYKINFKSTPREHGHVIAFVDEIIKWFAPRSGLIHVPSVSLRDRIFKGSQWRGRMVTYEGAGRGQTKDEAIEIFREQGAGEQRVLLGQSISTGVDIPYVPQFQVIYKLAFPPLTDVATKARSERDKSFYPFLVICELVQAAGRIKRAPDHDGTTFILDANFQWFFAQHRAHFPKWFLDALVYEGFEKYPDLKGAWARAKLRMVAVA